MADAAVRLTEWTEYNRSVRMDEELLTCFKKKRLGMSSRYRNSGIVQHPYAKPWICELKSVGHHIYITNCSKRTYELTHTNELDFLPPGRRAVFSFETGYVKPEHEAIQDTREKQMKAESERREAILRVEGRKVSAILDTEAEKQSAILRIEAKRQAILYKAEGQAEAILKIHQADARVCAI